MQSFNIDVPVAAGSITFTNGNPPMREPIWDIPLDRGVECLMSLCLCPASSTHTQYTFHLEMGNTLSLGQDPRLGEIQLKVIIYYTPYYGLVNQPEQDCRLVSWKIMK